MIKFYKKVESQLTELETSEENCWINIYPPFNHDKLRKLGNEFNIPFDYLIDSLDIDERSRFEVDEDVELILLKTPILNDVESEIDAQYITIPLGIILTPKVLITISSYENAVIDWFLNGKPKNFNPHDRSLFILKIFERNVYYFLYYLNEINNKRNLFEKELYSSMRNKELAKLLNIEKSLVYFVTSLRSNEMLLMKIQRIDLLEISKKEKESDILGDIIVDNSQALEMANIYTNILSGTMDAFASIISNNLNVVMKRLTSVTIVLMVPTLIASFYGMNVDLPFQHQPYAYLYTILISLILSVALVYFFLKKKWF